VRNGGLAAVEARGGAGSRGVSPKDTYFCSLMMFMMAEMWCVQSALGREKSRYSSGNVSAWPSLAVCCAFVALSSCLA
jgi:hypothetical protein